jgi:hypothetical protein
MSDELPEQVFGDIFDQSDSDADYRPGLKRRECTKYLHRSKCQLDRNEGG